MKKWMMLLTLCASVSIAEEPAPQPEPPEPAVQKVEQPLPEVPQPEIPQPETTPVDPAQRDLPPGRDFNRQAPPAPNGPPRPEMAQPPRPPGETETIVFEAVEAILSEPSPDGPPAPGSEATTQPATNPALILVAPLGVRVPMPSTAATVPTTGVATTMPATTTFATTGPSSRPVIASGYGNPYGSRDNRYPTRTAPTPAPRVVPVPKPLPADFAILGTRSFFVHGRMPLPGPPPGWDRPPATNTVVVESPKLRPEKNLLFNGSTKADGEWMALIEDTVAARILKVGVGDALAQGKVTAITLDTLDYDAAGKTRRIALGQNLDGESISGSTTRPSLAGAEPTTGPAAPSGALGDMLERLRQKRLKELGGGK